MLDLFILGKLEKYIDTKWQEISGEEHFKLTKLEGQVCLFFQVIVIAF